MAPAPSERVKAPARVVTGGQAGELSQVPMLSQPSTIPVSSDMSQQSCGGQMQGIPEQAVAQGQMPPAAEPSVPSEVQPAPTEVQPAPTPENIPSQGQTPASQPASQQGQLPVSEPLSQPSISASCDSAQGVPTQPMPLEASPEKAIPPQQPLEAQPVSQPPAQASAQPPAASPGW